MSNSVFKDYPSSAEECEKADSNLVVFINKNGSVSVDQTALQDLLVKDATDTNTSVSVIRVSSPTPSLQLELDEQDELERKMAKAHADDTDENDEEDDEDNDESEHSGSDEDDENNKKRSKKKEETVTHVSLTVENFYNPKEAKQLASDILSIAGITNPLQINVDYEFQRYVIANDHCYTPLTSPSQRSAVHSASTSRVSSPAAQKEQKKPADSTVLEDTKSLKVTPKSIRARAVRKESSDHEADDKAMDSNENSEDDDSEYSYESPSENENDRDSDLDFNVNDRSSRTKKYNRTKASRRQSSKTNARLSASKKRLSANDSTEPLDEPKKRPLKVPKKIAQPVPITKPSTSAVISQVAPAPQPAKQKLTPVMQKLSSPTLIKLGTPLPRLQSTPKLPVITNVTMLKGAVGAQPKAVPSSPAVPALATLSDSSKPTLTIVKKDKKPPAHVEALFSDMTSLFSTPDIIKKVGSDSSAGQVQPQLLPISAATTTTTTKVYFMPITPGANKNRQLPPQISIRNHTNNSNLGSEQDKQLDLIDSIVQQELKQTTTTPNNAMNPDIPSIVKMLQTTTSDSSNMIGSVINMSQATSVSNANSLTFAPITNDTTLLDDTDLLDGLANPEDGLTEDLLQHVAKLVEDKNLQEVIDKQVLGVSSSTSSTTSTTNKMVVTNVLKPPQQQVVITKQSAVMPPPALTTVSPVIRKEPIKIVRSDGRVITLPPIEAPTTRGAKRRAQNQPTESATPEKPKATDVQPEVDIIATTPVRQNRRQSVSQQKKHVDQGTPKGKQPLSAPATPLATTAAVDDIDDDDDEGSDGSYNSEDDPYRLWCICRQPHNNRFMICCDKCEDWFHGKCVSITKAMGVEMEQRSADWVCPNCVKKYNLPPPNLSSIRKAIEKKASLASKINEAAASVATTPIPSLTPPIPLCMVCKNPARKSSIYCSDDCILKHAHTTTTGIAGTESKTVVASRNNPSAGDQTIKPIVANKNNRVDVVERTTGRLLTGLNAPTLENLKQWLQDHPTYELASANTTTMAFNAKKDQLKKLAKTMESEQPQQQVKVQTTLKIGPSKKIMLVNPQAQKQLQQQQQQQQQNKPTVVKKIPQKVSLKPGTPPTTPKLPSNPGKTFLSKSSTPTQQLEANKKKPVIKNDQQRIDKMMPPSATNSKESIRVSVENTLREQLTIRMSEITDGKQAKLTAEEIEKFAKETESEIFHLFNKDTGNKYRVKYRSLTFNVKDRKNETLFRKICDKSITPKQLVRMSAEELASQELAQWRENENKHQLEMIKKSELDLLACAKNYVLKTHKGEEVIESKAVDRVTLDPSISVEDVVSVLNNSTVSSTSEQNQEDNSTNTNQSPMPTVKDTRIDSRFEKYLSVDSSSSGAAVSSKSSKSQSHHKKKDGKRERSRSRERSDSKKSSSKHKRKRSRERRSRSREKSRDVAKDIKDRSKKEDSSKGSSVEKRDSSLKRGNSDKKPEGKLPSKDSSQKPQKIEENFSLIDKILEAQSTIDRILRPGDPVATEKKKETQPIAMETQLLVKSTNSNIESDHEQPSSTVTIPTPPESLYNKDPATTSAATENFLWTGSIIMVDVATFQISMKGVSGDCSSITKQLPMELDVVGRIRPDTVWDYISKIKKSFNKEILLLQFTGANDDDADAYFTLYKYLSTRKRFGVIKTKSSIIKDFYILPLAAHKSLPSVLLPVNKPGFDNGRPDLLLGIIVKNTALPIKRPANVVTTVAAKVPRLDSTLHLSKTKAKTLVDEERYTPPSSPKMSIKLPVSAMAAEIASKVKLNKDEPVLEDGDEPYSPGGSDDGDTGSEFIPQQGKFSSLNKTPSMLAPPPPPASTSTSQLEQDEIQRKMDELNRQIEARKLEIALLNSDTVNDEPYSPTSNLSNAAPPPTLADISIPSNLQEILNSIKNASASTATFPSTSEPSDILMLSNNSTAIPLISDGGIGSDDEYTPTSVVPAAYKSAADYIPSSMYAVSAATLPPPPPPALMEMTAKSSTSKLAQLTDEELMSMVPDDAKLDLNLPKSDSKYKNIIEPPPPGLEEEYIP